MVLVLYLKSSYQLHFIVCCVKKGNLHISHVIEDGLSGKCLVNTPEWSKSKFLQSHFCLSKKQVFRKLLAKRQVGRVLAQTLINVHLEPTHRSSKFDFRLLEASTIFAALFPEV